MTSLNKPLQFLLLITTLLPCIITPISSHAQKTTNDLVKTMCQQTPDPKSCESELRSDPRSSTARDGKPLTLISIDIVKTRFSSSIQIIKDLAKKTHDPNVSQGLKNCINDFQLVVDVDVKVANDAVVKGNPKFGEEAMVDSGNMAEKCRNGIPSDKLPRQLASQVPILHGVSIVAASLIKTME